MSPPIREGGISTGPGFGRSRTGAATNILVTCEHGGHQVPGDYRTLFVGLDDVLASHRGWDPGSLSLARTLAHMLGGRLRFSTTTRLLVDLNRGAHNAAVFSEVTRALGPEERRRLLDRYHEPYRARVARDVAEAVGQKARVLHLSVHTFTPVWRGVDRTTDIGLLYDPVRLPERALAATWTRKLKERLPGWSIRRNHPYRGATDGLTTWLRSLHGPERYLGIEIEVSQRRLDRRGRVPARVVAALVEGVTAGLGTVA